MVKHYKCPNCGADMAFDSTSQMLLCGSCGHSDRIETFPENLIQEFPDDNMMNSPDDSTKEYHCRNCGAVLITDADTTATTCSFCGAGVTLTDRLSGTLTPAKVIPFHINKNQAQEAFRKWCKNGRLTPKGFMTADRIKSITGMYVPFWLYDLEGKAEVNALCTKVRSYTRGDYIYTDTSEFHVYRKVNLRYKKIPVDASEKMNDQLMDRLEPYDYSSLKDFNTPYLAGYIAEKYNHDEVQSYPRAEQRAENYVNTFLGGTINGYSSISYHNKKIDIQKREAYYTLLPVWMVCYDYKQSEHTFAMNGQTGKIVGKPPLSKGKIASWFMGVSGISFIILSIIGLITGGGF